MNSQCYRKVQECLLYIFQESSLKHMYQVLRNVCYAFLLASNGFIKIKMNMFYFIL